MSTLQIITRFPSANTVTAARSTYIFIGATNTVGGISPTTLRITVNGAIAYHNGAFSTPDFTGEVLLTNTYAAIKLQPRREFAYLEQVTVVTELTDNQVPPVNTLTDTYSFYVTDRPPTVANSLTVAPCQSRMMSAFPDPYIDAFRQAIISSLTPNTALAPQAAVYRLDESLSQALETSLQVTVPTNLLDRDLIPLLTSDMLIQNQMVLWPLALQNLNSIGIGPRTTSALNDAMQSAYPHNRVGAACGAVLLAAAFYAAMGA
jgi:hypothetical protein